jgi:hypothetical protein
MTFLTNKDMADIHAGRKTIHIVPFDLFTDSEIEYYLRENGLRLTRTPTVRRLYCIGHEHIVEHGIPEAPKTQYGSYIEFTEEDFRKRWNDRYSASQLQWKANPFVKIIRFKKYPEQ